MLRLEKSICSKEEIVDCIVKVFEFIAIDKLPRQFFYMQNFICIPLSGFQFLSPASQRNHPHSHQPHFSREKALKETNDICLDRKNFNIFQTTTDRLADAFNRQQQQFRWKSSVTRRERKLLPLFSLGKRCTCLDVYLLLRAVGEVGEPVKYYRSETTVEFSFKITKLHVAV